MLFYFHSTLQRRVVCMCTFTIQQLHRSSLVTNVHSVSNALVDDTQQVLVLQRRTHSLLVCQLLPHRRLTGVRARLNLHFNLEARWQRSQQLDPNGQSNEGGHGAVRNGGREANVDRGHGGVVVVHGNVVPIDHVELRQGERVFWILNVPDDVKDFVSRVRFSSLYAWSWRCRWCQKRGLGSIGGRRVLQSETRVGKQRDTLSLGCLGNLKQCGVNDAIFSSVQSLYWKPEYRKL